MPEQLDFSTIKIQEVQVTAPTGQQYTLREASGGAAKEHRNAIMASTQFGPDGKVTGIKGLASVEAKLVAACLWDSKDKNPPVSLVESWPARVQKKLYETVKEISDLGEGDPIREAMEKAFATEDCPFSLEQLSNWATSLEGEEFIPFVRLFEKRDLKNS